MQKQTKCPFQHNIIESSLLWLIMKEIPTPLLSTSEANKYAFLKNRTGDVWEGRTSSLSHLRLERGDNLCPHKGSEGGDDHIHQPRHSRYVNTVAVDDEWGFLALLQYQVEQAIGDGVVETEEKLREPKRCERRVIMNNRLRVRLPGILIWKLVEKEKNEMTNAQLTSSDRELLSISSGTNFDSLLDMFAAQMRYRVPAM
jgi:hypothetical protein